MTAFEPLILALAIPGAVVALRDICARHALPHDAPAARASRGGAPTHASAAPARTIELAISVRFHVARARDALGRRHAAQAHPAGAPASTERADADAS